MMQKTVLLIDDHPVVSLGVTFALRDHGDLSLVGTAATMADAFALIDQSVPDVLIVDLTFMGHVDLSLIATLRDRAPLAAIIVFSSLPERIYGGDALAKGADAYLSKDNDLSRLIEVVKKLLAEPADRRRRAPTAAKLEEEASAPSQPLTPETAQLTPREREIAHHLSRGLSVAEIARLVGASPNTIAVHRDNLRRKLQCRDSTELVARLARFYGSGLSL